VSFDIRRLAAGDEERARAAAALFDDPFEVDAARRFLDDDSNVLLVAYVEGEPAGFVTGTLLAHPDKPAPELFLNELGVDDPYRGRGIGRALVEQLWRVAQERGCRGMWVLTDDGNVAANKVYAAAGAIRVGAEVMYQWGDS